MEPRSNIPGKEQNLAKADGVTTCSQSQAATGDNTLYESRNVKCMIWYVQTSFT